MAFSSLVVLGRPYFMNPKLVTFILSIFAASGWLRAASEVQPIEFVGCISTKTETLFVIKDGSAGAISGWLGVGQSFRGHTIESYDSALETLTLRNAGKRIDVKLQTAKTREGTTENAGPPQKSAGLPSQPSINLSGALRNPIKIEAHRISTLAEGIEAAGGLKEGAKANGVRLLRREANGSLKTYSIDASSNSTGERSAKSFVLRPGDVVFVPSENNGKQ